MPKLLETFKELESSEKEEVWTESEQGLTYVTRTLLFKALHNAIERKLCNEGWTRMVRWFIKVPESSQNSNSENKTRPAAISIRYSYKRKFVSICFLLQSWEPLAEKCPKMKKNTI